MNNRDRLLYPAFDEAFRPSWIRRALSVERASLIGLWLQNEASGTDAFDISGLGNDGVYADVTLGQAGIPGLTCPYYDGVDGFNNIHSAGLATAFSGVAGTVLFPIKIPSATEWTDGLWHHGINIRYDAENYIRLVKHANNNRLAFYYEAGNAQKYIFKEGVSSLDWMWTGITWDKNAGVDGEVKAFYNGDQEGLTLTGLGVWVGVPTIMCIGSFDTVPQLTFKGWISPVLLSTKAYTPAQMKYLS